jgi:hypothetical protein
MSDSTLERRYRRLLAWYPAAFRREREEEILAVLLASSPDGQRRPRLAESLDLIRSAIGIRARRIGSWLTGQRQAEGLAEFTVTAPVMLLLATVLEVAVPYRLGSAAAGVRPLVAHFLGAHPEIGGLRLLSSTPFVVALACQAVIAALVLAGQRWLALAAIAGTAGCWIANVYQVPELLQVLSASVFLLAGAALIASPGPRRGRRILTWRYGIVLALCLAAIAVSTLLYDAASPVTRFLGGVRPDSAVYLAVSAALAAVAAALAASFRLNGYFLLFLAVMFYPYVLQRVPRHSSSDNLIGLPTPQHLTVLFLPALLLALAAILAAVLPRHRMLPSPESGPPSAHC